MDTRAGLRHAVFLRKAGGMKRVVVFGLLILLPGMAGAAELLPKAMWGLWAYEPADCANLDSDGHLTIDAKTVAFYASGYDVKWVVRKRDGSLRASGLVSNEGEQGLTRDALTLKLIAPDKLHVVTEDGHTYYRCPKPSKSENRNGKAQ
jgi:hypothetical protein